MSSDMIQVWRGILLTESEIQDLQRRYGTYIRLRQHPWWATEQGIAKVYATTEKIKGERNIPVLMWGRLRNYTITTPCLPNLSKHPTAQILFDYLEVLK